MEKTRTFGLLAVAILLLGSVGGFVLAEEPPLPGENFPLVVALEEGQPAGFIYLILDVPIDFDVKLPPGVQPVDPPLQTTSATRASRDSRPNTGGLTLNGLAGGIPLSGSSAGAGASHVRPEPALDELDSIARDLGLR